jgi:glutathione peroxidase
MKLTLTFLTLAATAALNLPARAAAPAPATPMTPSAAPSSACPVTLRHTLPRLQDETPQDLCQYSGKVVLVVNTASYCGYTPQYKGLEALNDKYRSRGLVVLGFPSNDFEQEKGSNKEIAEFCENTFGVRFPMFGASHVKGPQANPVFKQLAGLTGQEPKWNFYKYLIGRDGKVVGNWPSRTTPQELEPLIEKQLAAR